MGARAALLILLAVVWAPAMAAEDAVSPDRLRQTMVRLIEIDALATSDVTGVENIDPRVLKIMARVPRHLFVPQAFQSYAYNMHPLPLGYDQNIAAPFLVALMTHVAELGPDDVVFETGTGAGYHAAVLAELASKVFSVEVVEPLAEQAAERLADMGYGNVAVKAGDGYYGWAEHGPFDAIIVKEAVDHVPAPLLNQLKPGGRMVLPLGSQNGAQHLTVIRKSAEGRLDKTRILPVRFSPLQGGERT